MNMANLKALKAISKAPIHVGPFVQSTTHALVPFFNDSRALYSHPKEFFIFIEELAKIVRRCQKRGRIDLIVGIPMAGIPIAMALSLKTGIPFAYMNKERKKTLRKRIVEGEYKKGARAVLVDDVPGKGTTIFRAIADCRADGIAVQHVFTLWNPWWPWNKKFIQKLKKRGITYDTLYSRLDWIDYLHKHGIVSREAVEIQQAYLPNPTGWHKDKKMWRKFLAWKNRWKKTGKL